MLLLNIYSRDATAPGMLFGMNFSSHVIDIWVIFRFGVIVCVITGLV